jgi:serine/threonine protein kinase
MPPELFFDSRRDSAGDVWAFGIIMLYILKKIQYPENMVESWNIHGIRQRTSKAAKQMKTWLNVIINARDHLDPANPVEYVTLRMLDENRHSRITAAGIMNNVERLQ